MKKKYSHYKTKFIFALLLAVIFVLKPATLYVWADQESTETNEYQSAAEARKNNAVETNSIEGWPDGPLIGAEAAILMNADTGQILYAKNIDAKLYPASTTKIMTCLVAIENAELTEKITVNQSAIDANEPDGSNMGLTAGEVLTLDELLHGILISSANEACNAVAQHISGDIDSYVELMNKKAVELGCKNTHFVSTNGLNNPDHYTSAYDLALIGREFFSYDILCRLSSTGMYEIEETSEHKAHSLYSKNKLYVGRSHEYTGLLGSKTGFTSDARQTLVSCAERDGIRLIAVVLKEESPAQFQDTIDLFDYGFSNFSKVNIAASENKYSVDDTGILDNKTSLFGSRNMDMFIDDDAYVLLPAGIDFSMLESQLDYEKSDEYFGCIKYYYQGNYMGGAKIGVSFDNNNSYDANNDVITAGGGKMIMQGIGSISGNRQIIVDIRRLVGTVSIIFVVTVILTFLYKLGMLIYVRRRHMKNIKKTRNVQSANQRRRQALSRTNYEKPHKVKKSDTNGGFSKRKPRSIYKPPIVSTLFNGNKDNNRKKVRTRRHKSDSYTE